MLVLTLELCSNALMGVLVTAIKALRSRLDDSQQAFANRLGLSLRAVANYEDGRQPVPRVLTQFVNLASCHKFDDLARVFSSAYADAMKGRSSPVNKDEAAWTRVLLLLLRNREMVPTWEQLARDLIDALEKLIASARIKKNLRTDFQELEETLIAARLLVRPPSAEDKITNMAQARSAETGESFEKSYSEVLLQNPELYQQYLQERADAARGTRLEGSLAVAGTRQRAERQQAGKRSKGTKARK
jgi:transcriptional regulator with XRE-family HTH domain